MSEKLKPCPFCSALNVNYARGNSAYVYCGVCGSRGKGFSSGQYAEHRDVELAIEFWNTRTGEAELVEAYTSIVDCNSSGSDIDFERIEQLLKKYGE